MNELIETEIGKLPKNWEVRSLEEISKRVSVGYVGLTSKFYTDETNGVPLLRSQNVRNGRIDNSNLAFVTHEFHNNNKKSKLVPGDVMIVRVGENRGDTSMLPSTFKEVNCANVVFFRPLKGYSKFLELYLRTPNGRHSLLSLTTGSAQGVINTTSIAKMHVPVPPIEEALQIAKIFETLEVKIDLLHKQNHTLEQLAETLFRQWLVEIKEESTMGEEFDIVMGQSPPGTTYNEIGDGLPFYQGRSDFKFRFPTVRVYCSAPTRVANSGDTLLSVRAPVGDLNMAREKCCIGRGVAAIRHKNKKVHPSYTYLTLLALKESFDMHDDTGTMFGSINRMDLSNLKCAKLPFEKVELFNSEIGTFDDKLTLNCNQIETLTNLRDTLLPKLMSGELRVSTNKNELLPV